MLSWLRIQHLRLKYPGIAFHGPCRVSSRCQIICVDGGELILDRVTIAAGVVLRVYPGARLELRKCYVGPRSVLIAAEEVTVGPGCRIGPEVVIRDHDHVFGPGKWLPESGMVSSPLRIGANCRIEAGVSVLRGVDLPDSSLVRARAVVNRSPAKAGTLAGLPAKLI